jgi:hypothetical protein
MRSLLHAVESSRYTLHHISLDESSICSHIEFVAALCMAGTVSTMSDVHDDAYTNKREEHASLEISLTYGLFVTRILNMFASHVVKHRP